MGGLVRYRADATHPPARVSNHEGRHNDTSKREGRLTDRVPQNDRVWGAKTPEGASKSQGVASKRQGVSWRFEAEMRFQKRALMAFPGRDARCKGRLELEMPAARDPLLKVRLGPRLWFPSRAAT